MAVSAADAPAAELRGDPRGHRARVADPDRAWPARYLTGRPLCRERVRAAPRVWRRRLLQRPVPWVIRGGCQMG